jgi:hypothetical protein
MKNNKIPNKLLSDNITGHEMALLLIEHTDLKYTIIIERR